ncbi:MAG: hypothetical protein AB1847_15265 [bacterium]
MTTEHNNIYSFSFYVKLAPRKILLTILMLPLMSISSALAANPPRQPSSGPGGSDYTHRSVRSSSHGFGALQYYIFEPDTPQPASAPLIVFTHGYGGTNPMSYGAWIEHIVKKGNIVVYPKYQSMTSMIGGSRQYTSNCIKSVQDALKVLQGSGHVKPDLDKCATVGHSYGGLLTVNIAALAQKSGIPVPKAVMSVEPGISITMPLEDLSSIPPETLLLTIVGDRDTVVGNRDARKIFRLTPQIPPENKDYVLMVSDRHGTPGLSATHFAPTCMAPVGGMVSGLGNLIPSLGGSLPNLGGLGPDFGSLETDPFGPASESGGFLGAYFDNLISYSSDTVSVMNDSINAAALSDSTADPIADLAAMPDFEFLLPVLASAGPDVSGGLTPMFGTNALDYYCTWKLFDALIDAAFFGKNREYALGNTPLQRYMGEWSDGKPVKELVVTDNP